MKKIILFTILTTFLISCTNDLDVRFRQRFKDYLTNEQIDLILEINSNFDKFVIEKHPEKLTDLKSCYAFMTDEINMKGGYDDYFYSDDKLIEIRKLIIEVGLFDDSKNKNYLKSLEKLSHKDKEVKEIFYRLSGSGYYYLHESYLHLGLLSHHGEMNSISKILLTFQFVVGQVEDITTANNS